MQATPQPFLSEQAKEIQEVFDEFKQLETMQIDVNEFIEILQTIGMDRNCELLIRKLELLRGRKLDQPSFVKLFNFDYQDKDNFEMIFNMMDSSKSGKISRDELKKQNDIWGLQLTDRDMDIMITYTGEGQGEFVTKETLWNLIKQSQQQS